MTDVHNSLGMKVRTILRESFGEREERLNGARPTSETMQKITDALTGEHGFACASDIGFHMADWNSDAAFITALHLFPERFTNEEVSAGISMFLVHAPNHVAAAAKLAGHPIQDAFGLGPLVEP